MVFLYGEAIPEPDPRGNAIRDDSFLLVFNAGHEATTFTLPSEGYGARWVVEIDTAADVVTTDPLAPRQEIVAQPRSFVLLRSPREDEARPPAGAAQLATEPATS